MLKWIIGAVVVLVVVIFTFSKMDPTLQTSNYGNNNTTLVLEGDKQVVVIEGQIVHPGSYTMSKEDTIGDLVTKAGGLLESADEEAIYMEASLENREQVYIPMKNTYSSECLVEDVKEKVNINKASSALLATVNGISTSIAENIVAYRDEHGLFYALEDVMNVTGIGPKTYEKIRDYIKLK